MIRAPKHSCSTISTCVIQAHVSAALHGCYCGTHCVPSPVSCLALQRYADTIAALKLTDNDAQQLFDFFHQVDEDGSGQVSLIEFFDFLDLKRTRFAKRAFGLFDEDNSGEIVRVGVWPSDGRALVCGCAWVGSHLPDCGGLFVSTVGLSRVCGGPVVVLHLRQERVDNVCV